MIRNCAKIGKINKSIHRIKGGDKVRMVTRMSLKCTKYAKGYCNDPKKLELIWFCSDLWFPKLIFDPSSRLAPSCWSWLRKSWRLRRTSVPCGNLRSPNAPSRRRVRSRSPSGAEGHLRSRSVRNRKHIITAHRWTQAWSEFFFEGLQKLRKIWKAKVFFIFF